MVQRIHHFITVLALLLFVTTGCDEVLQGISEEQQSEPSSLTVTRDTDVSSSDNGSAADKAPESAVYDFNDLSKACVVDHELPSTYRDLEFEQAPRWPVCLAYPSTEGHDGMAIMPIDSRLHHKNNNGTTLLADDRIRLPEPADSVSLVTANHDRPLVNYITQRNYASWLVAYDEEANEIDRALNSRGGHTGVVLIVRGSTETPIHMIGIETYPQSTYFDNLTVWKAKTVLPDETPPHFNYTVETDTLFPADRQLHLAVSDIYASDDRGGTVTMTVSVATCASSARGRRASWAVRIWMSSQEGSSFRGTPMASTRPWCPRTDSPSRARRWMYPLADSAGVPWGS